MRFFLISLALAALLAAGCKGEACDPIDQDNRILDYISANSLLATPTGSGLYYIVTAPGSTRKPAANSQVRVRYTGKLTDGYIFDRTIGTEIRTFRLNEVIPGWTEGMQLFGEGGKGTLIIPCQLGYGSNDTGDIPPGSVLIFEIELIDVL